MASTYSELKIELIGNGEQSGTWGTTTNVNLGTALEEAITGRATANFPTDANLTLGYTNSNATQVFRNLILNVTSSGNLTATRDLIVPTIEKQYLVENNTSGGQSIVVKTSAGTGVTVPNGKKVHVYANGTNVVYAFDQVGDLSGVSFTSSGAGSFGSVTSSGTSTATKFIPTGNVTTGNGMYLPTTNTLAFSTDSTERMVIASNGNVGIGTSSPSSLLSLGSSVTNKKLFIYDDTSSAYGFGIASAELRQFAGTGANLTFGHYTLSTDTFVERLRIDSAGTAVTAQDMNVNGLRVGRGAGNDLRSLGFGHLVLNANTTGIGNVAIGMLALADNTEGVYNTAVGSTYDASFDRGALGRNTTGNNNTAVGLIALANNTTGVGNTALGTNTLYRNTTGTLNVALGFDALLNNTTGRENIAIGSSFDLGVARGPLGANTTGGYNTAIGSNALSFNTTASTNVAVGAFAAFSNTTGLYNTALGTSAFVDNTTGSYNTAVGTLALVSNTTGNYNTAIGTTYSTNDQFGALGRNTTGNSNTAVGLIALYSNTTGGSNTAIGASALLTNTTAINNTAVGLDAGRFVTTGSNNSAFGYRALLGGQATEENVAIGVDALSATTGVGYNAAVGNYALFSLTSGQNNAAIGYGALESVTTGINNTAVGLLSGRNISTGSGNITLGYRNSSNNDAPVFNVTTENHRVVMGTTSITNAYIQVAWTVVSDARDKRDFASVPHGLDFVNQLEPVSFRFKVSRDNDAPNGPVRYGFKAQDILELEGDSPVIIDNEDPEKLRYNGESLIPVLVNAVKELSAQVEQLKTEINQLKGA
jgi:trimeric autotransporter adhesin